MIEIHAGKNRTIGIEYIDRVQPTAQSHLQNRNVNLGLAEQIHGGQCAKLEIGQGYAATHPCRFDSVESLAQLIIACFLPVDPHAFVIAQ